jgi:hypothetical protein
VAPIVVTSRFVWSHYPGLRAGRIYAGKSDIYQRPAGDAHLVGGPEATETLCGASRAGFPYDFPDAASIGASPLSTPCPTCAEHEPRT